MAGTGGERQVSPEIVTSLPSNDTVPSKHADPEMIDGVVTS
jgi:hypothetical protein